MKAHLNGLDGLLAPLPAGGHAPDFTLRQVVQATPEQALQSTQLRLRRVDRSQALVLVFYPMDWEGVSREQLTLYQNYSDTFTRLGARLLGISIDHILSLIHISEPTRL